MAPYNQVISSKVMSTNSNDTALCIIPPNIDCRDIDRLRELYDKAYGKWPAHINLIYPFVAPDSLPRAQEQIKTHLAQNLNLDEPQTVALTETGLFKHRNNSTIFLQENASNPESSMATIRSMALQAIGQKHTASNLHLTIGQSEDNTLFSQHFLLSKAQLLPALNFRIGALAILIRERSSGPTSVDHMRLWGVIDLSRPGECWRPSSPEHWVRQLPMRSVISTFGHDNGDSKPAEILTISGDVQPGHAFKYNSQQHKWIACQESERNSRSTSNVTISSYNVLVDSEYPPERDRDTFLTTTMLSIAATADILVLQEVSDDFLSHILNNPELQTRYPFTSHAPPSQPEIGPLSSLRNIVILSSWSFSWKFVPFHRKHKGALVAQFGRDNQNALAADQDLIVAGVHLTAGLTDSSVAAKQAQLQTLTDYLVQQHSADAWIIAGDFNIPTSVYTINTALKESFISHQTIATLSSIEAALNDVGLIDAWAVAHVEAADEVVASNYDEVFEGEEGATFDPRYNILAAATSETSNGRPQRYDRVFVRSQGALRVLGFNQFGLPENIDGAQVVASDHSGIRSKLDLSESSAQKGSQSMVVYRRASSELSGSEGLNAALAMRRMFPTEEEERHRQNALAVLNAVITGGPITGESAASDVPFIVVAVGSYALGVWTSGSDIDCLCIGTISSKTFFKLARQRLLKAHDQGVRILRKVEANTGTMLELCVNGVAMDLQYCPAANVVER
jgi:endonuclease/exonuclease/phosphatase family metal-dependent hydrolase